MKKAVLFSINPEWAHRIVDGEKQYEIRKTAPKIPIPYTGYLYMTSGGYEWRDPWCTAISPDGRGDNLYNGAQRVIASFVVDKVHTIKNFGSRFVVDCTEEAETNRIAKESCLNFVDMQKYAGDRKVLYALHITNVKVFDEPKEISDFYRLCPKPNTDTCYGCKYLFKTYTQSGWKHARCTRALKRPPQSWFYVEELE